MRIKKNLRYATLVLPFFGVTSNLFASGFQVFELASPSTATAGVGQAAYANDASTAYFNPAGMPQLDHSQFLLGTQALFPTIQFSENFNNTLPGGNGKKTRLPIPSAGLYYVNSNASPLKWGVSVTSPYGGLLRYGDNWAGRHFVENNFLLTLNVNPSLAYQVNNWLSLGVGVVGQYTRLDQSVALHLPGEPFDGKADLTVSRINPGWNAGILLMPRPSTRVGLAYRSQIKQTLEGNTTFGNISIMPKTTVQILTPNTLIGSLYQEVTERLALVGEAGWANWRSFYNTVVTISGFEIAVPRRWCNTWRAGVGGRYQVTESVIWMAGVSYDSSPANTGNRLPDLPMDRQVRVGTGLLYTTRQNVQIGLQYEFINFGKASIDQQIGFGRLSGQYSSNYGNVLSLTVNFGV